MLCWPEGPSPRARLVPALSEWPLTGQGALVLQEGTRTLSATDWPPHAALALAGAPRAQPAGRSQEGLGLIFQRFFVLWAWSKQLLGTERLSLTFSASPPGSVCVGKAVAGEDKHHRHT